MGLEPRHIKQAFFTIDWKEALTFLFKQENWLLYYLKGLIIMLIPVINICAFTGWSLEIIKQFITEKQLKYLPVWFKMDYCGITLKIIIILAVYQIPFLITYLFFNKYLLIPYLAQLFSFIIFPGIIYNLIRNNYELAVGFKIKNTFWVFYQIIFPLTGLFVLSFWLGTLLTVIAILLYHFLSEPLTSILLHFFSTSQAKLIAQKLPLAFYFLFLPLQIGFYAHSIGQMLANVRPEYS